MLKNKAEVQSNQETSMKSLEQTNVSSEIVKQRLMELLTILQARMEQEPTEAGSMSGMGMGVITMMVMQTDPQKLTSFLNLCVKSVQVVLKSDLHPQQYEEQLEPLLLEFMQAL